MNKTVILVKNGFDAWSPSVLNQLKDLENNQHHKTNAKKKKKIETQAWQHSRDFSPPAPTMMPNLISSPDICTANWANVGIDDIYKGIQKSKYMQDLLIEDWGI